jgi:hypothetical protein
VTMPMFDLPDVPAPAVGEPTGRRAARKPKPDAIRWSKYRPKERVPCDNCLADLVDAEGVDPLARPARYRRQQGNRDALLCTKHMEVQREADGFNPMSDADGQLR